MGAILESDEGAPSIHSAFTFSAANGLLRAQSSPTRPDLGLRIKMDGMLSPFTRRG